MEVSQFTEAFRLAVGQLRKRYDAGESSAIARVLFEEITGHSYSSGLTRTDPLDPAMMESIRIALERMDRGEPLQHILGYTDFFGLRLEVSSEVLIPRPETEELVQWMLDDTPSGTRGTLLDIGTGSGCIPVAFSHHRPAWICSALDKSAGALAVARRNAARLGCEVLLKLSDFLDEQTWSSAGHFDILVSNPPYIPLGEAAEMEENVREFEPHLALFVPDGDPLLFYRKIAAFGKDHLRSRGGIYCELHRDYADATQQLFLAEGYDDVQVRQDMHGAARMLRAKMSL